MRKEQEKTRGRQFVMLRCAMAGVTAVEAKTRHVFPRHTHDQYGIGIIHQGAHKSLSGRGMVEAGVGDVITVNPGEVHDGAPIGDRGRSWRILYFDPWVITEAVADMSEGKSGHFEFSQPVIKDERVAQRLKALLALLTGDGALRLAGEEMLVRLLANVLAEQEGMATARGIPGAIASALRLIDDDPVRPVTLTELAKASGLSRFQLLRGFFKATGLTPHAYLVQRRIDLARRLIAKRLPLAEAAVASGFADQSHMTRIFVRKYGVSPGLYADAVNA